jgi:hypothetical protein
MSVAEFKQVYPEAKWGFEKKDDSGQLIEALVSQPTVGNRFWESAVIYFLSDKVVTYGYCGVLEWDSSKENVPEIYRQLVRHFGVEPEKNTAKSDLVDDEKMPVYLWKANDLIYTFSHTPFAQHQKGEIFSCLLRVIRQDKLNDCFQEISDYDEKDAELFKDLSDITINYGENTKLWYGLVVIAILGTLLVLAVFMYMRKRKTGN